MGGKIYRRTAAGRTAFLLDSSLELDYRILLAVLEVDTPSAQFKLLLPSYSEAMVNQRLGELGAMGLVQSSPAPAATSA